MRYFSRRRTLWILSLTATALVVGGSRYFSRVSAQETSSETTIAPGLTLLTVSTNTPNGPLRYWLVKAEPGSWDLGLEVADKGDALKKRNVRALAQQSGATVAINGGFFAYGGAAVGAVKTNGEWLRLPWKSRTALGWSDGAAQIDSLSGHSELQLTLQDGTQRTETVALNGFTLPGSPSAITDGFAVLTRRFATKWKRKAGEDALVFQGGKPVPLPEGPIPTELVIPDDGFVIVARGAALPILPQIQSAAWSTVVSPPGFDQFAQILGAGPRLVQNGVAKTTEVEEEFRPDVVAQGPRTAVGWDKDKNWLFLVADGRQAVSAGLTLPDTAKLFAGLGAVEAMNLDGGSSTQLVINGELINRPSGFDPVNPLRPREVMVSNGLVFKAKTQ